MLAASKTVN